MFYIVYIISTTYKQHKNEKRKFSVETLPKDIKYYQEFYDICLPKGCQVPLSSMYDRRIFLSRHPHPQTWWNQPPLADVTHASETNCHLFFVNLQQTRSQELLPAWFHPILCQKCTSGSLVIKAYQSSQ